MAATQQALLMASDNAVTVPEACEADPYYSCGPTNDPYWANVVLSMHFDGDLVDEKGHAFSADGTTFTSSGKFADAVDIGGTAVTGGGSNVVYLVTATTDFWLDGGDFTIEGWVKNNATNNNRPRYLCRLARESDNSDYLQIFINESGDVWSFSYPTALSTTTGISSAIPCSIGTYQHVALTRQGSTYRLFVDGIQASTATNTYLRPSAATTVHVGNSRRSFVDALCGEIDDLRITKGIARYTGNFNIPTAAFPDALETVWDPADPRTVLSLHADDVVVEDASCYQPKTVTLSGTLGNIAEVTDVESKFGGKSFSVPNSGSSTTAGIIVTDHQDLDFGTEDFTIEMWAYRTANTYYGTLFYGTYGGEFSLIVAPTTGLVVLNYRSSGGAQTNVATGVVFPLTTWQHVVVQRRGTNFEFYLNGVLGNTTAITGGASSTVNSSGDFYLGRTNASSALTWAGYIDEVRITKGVARYTAAFDPATMPNCDSVVPGNIVAVPGTSPLTGMSVTVQQQTIGDQNGAVALSGVSATVNAGGLFSDSVTSSKTVALTGRSVTVSRGTLAVPAYPNLISVSTTTIEAVATGNTAKLTFTFFTDGTYTVVDQALTTRTSGTWIDTAQTNYSIPAISNQYRVVTINIFAGTSYTYSTLPFTLGTSFSVVIQNLASSTLNIFDFQLTISPTSTNPRYAEPYYYGTHRFKAVLSNDMS